MLRARRSCGWSAPNDQQPEFLMSEPAPLPGWQRVTNPVVPTLAVFPGGDSANASPVRRLVGATTTTAVTFAGVPELHLILQRHTETEPDQLARRAAELIQRIDALDRQHGGAGVVYEPTTTLDEPTRLVLRLLPQVADATTPARFRQLAEELNRHAEAARRELVADQGSDLARRIASLSDKAILHQANERAILAGLSVVAV